MVTRKCFTATSTLEMFKIFLGIIRFCVMYCLNFFQSGLPVMSLWAEVDNNKDASIVILYVNGPSQVQRVVLGEW